MQLIVQEKPVGAKTHRVQRRELPTAPFPPGVLSPVLPHPGGSPTAKRLRAALWRGGGLQDRLPVIPQPACHQDGRGR